MSFRPAARMFFERRASAPSALPYDAEVKWLESTGTQWIDTGIGISKNLYCEVSFSLTEVGKGNNAPFGANNGRTWLAFATRLEGSTIYCGTFTQIAQYDPSDIQGNLTISVGDWHVAKIDTTEGSNAASFQLDDHAAAQKTATPASVSTPTLYLFGSNGTGITERAKCRIGYCKIKDKATNTLIRDLIPVRFTNELHESEGAMYDRVSKTLFRNAGTGKFIVGADAGMPYDCEVAYVEGRTGYGNATVGIHLESSVYSGFLDKSRSSIDITTAVFASRYYNGSGNIFAAGYCKVGGVMISAAGGATNNSITILSSGNGSHVCSSLDDFRCYKYTLDGNGHMAGYIDGVAAGSGTSTTTTKFNDEQTWCYLNVLSNRLETSSQQNTVRVGKMSISSGNRVLVDATPVIANGSFGWYNQTSGNVSAVSNDCIFAGPVVSNEGPRPYAYKVQYIETDGVASYIDTGIPADGSDVKLVFNFAFVGEDSSIGNMGNLLFGIQSGWNIIRCDKTYITPANYTFDTDGNTFYECEMQYFAGDRYSKVNGTTVNTNTGTGVAAVDANYPIGAYYAKANESADTNITRVGRVKCAKFLAFDKEGNCILNLIPVVDRNGVACMYDYVTKTLKYNAASSGTITAGPRAA